MWEKFQSKLYKFHNNNKIYIKKKVYKWLWYKISPKFEEQQRNMWIPRSLIMEFIHNF